MIVHRGRLSHTPSERAVLRSGGEPARSLRIKGLRLIQDYGARLGAPGRPQGGLYANENPTA